MFFFSTGERERERERIKNNKERIFNWNGKKIEVLMLEIL